jgi:hypothetical protein
MFRAKLISSARGTLETAVFGSGLLWMTGFTDFATGERRPDRRQRPRKSINPE